jgi:glycosyltransferase involved in cell wall biosynthesis
MARIAIDLTPLLPGGANGGVKIMTIRLIKELAKLSPQDQFILLANSESSLELETLSSENIRITCVLSSSQRIFRYIKKIIKLFKHFAIKQIKIFFPISVIKNLKFLKEQLKKKLRRQKTYISNYDLLFCPFTAPLFHNTNTPTISVVLDLQALYYPFFFSDIESYERQKNFYMACQHSNRIVCISDFVRHTVLEKSELKPEQVKTIHIRTAHRLPHLDKPTIQHTLEKFELNEQRFLLYPANFWPHKNHKILFTAFNMYHSAHPESRLKLVCTGASNPHKKFLQSAIKKMGLDHQIIFPGYLTDKEFSSLVKSCRAIIFPSLYEGFGMPILEAMANGKPVLCSNLTSLPEVAGEAALLFDPRQPEEIANAIYRIENEPELAERLIKAGYKQVSTFGTETDMAKEYLDLFHETIYKNKQ